MPAFRRVIGDSGQLMVFANLVVFGSCAALAFWRNLVILFDSQDGLYMLVEGRIRLGAFQPTFAFSNNFLQSIGNIQVLQNPRLLFYLWPLGWFDNVYVAEIVAYVFIALVVFLSAYAMARLLSQDRKTALTAGWLLGALAPPLVPATVFYPILSSSPTAVVLIAAPVVGFWLMHLAGRSTLAMDGLAALGLIALLLYLLSTNPGVVVLLALAAVPYAALAFLLRRGRSEAIRKLIVLTVVAIVAVALRWPWFLLGLFSYSAASVFPDDFTVVYRDAVYVSVMFQGSMFGWPGPTLVAVSAGGALLSLRRQELRAASYVLLATIAAFITALVVLLTAKRWLLPPPIYLEMSIWPLYAVFAAVALWRAIGFVAARPGAVQRSADSWARAGWMLPIPAVIIVAIASLSRTPNYSGVDLPRTTPMVDMLKSNVALAPGADFRGRVATIVPVAETGEDPWSQQFSAVLKLWRAIGNDQMSIGLWDYRIPTLFEYNQFSSPLFHALIKRTLQRPVMQHYRNITVISHADLRVLRLLGVRYVIMPREHSQIGEQRIIQEVAGQKWGLFELSAPNLATYSPTSIEIRRDLASTLDFLSDDRFDLARTAVVREEIGGPLVPAETLSLSMSDGDLHVVARSPGRSLLIVPLEFSHCIELHEKRGGPSAPAARLVRVDGLLTGVLFEHDVDAVLAFRTGPLHNPTCRWQDYEELRTMLR